MKTMRFLQAACIAVVGMYAIHLAVFSVGNFVDRCLSGANSKELFELGRRYVTTLFVFGWTTTLTYRALSIESKH